MLLKFLHFIFLKGEYTYMAAIQHVPSCFISKQTLNPHES